MMMLHREEIQARLLLWHHYVLLFIISSVRQNTSQQKLPLCAAGKGPAGCQWQRHCVALLTVCGAAAGAVAGAVAHLDALPPHLQQARVGQARLAGVAETLLVVTAVV